MDKNTENKENLMSKKELEEQMLSKMTKYDRKQYLREKQKIKEKRRAKITKVLSSIGALCFCGFIGFAIYVANLPYMVVGDKYDIEKDEINFYYSRNIEDFMNTYGNYVSYLGLDTSKPLSAQVYDSQTGETWEDYFIKMAKKSVTQVYSILDMGKESDFVYAEEESDLAEFKASFEEAASKANLTPDGYAKSLYGNSMTAKKIYDYVKNYNYSIRFSNHIYESFEVDEASIETYYKENNVNFDTFNYLAYEMAPTYESNATNELKESAIKLNKEVAEKFYEEEIKKVTNKDEFIKAIDSLIAEDDKDKEKYKDGTAITYTDASIVYEDEKVIEWLNDSSRKMGDFTLVTTDETCYFLYFESKSLDTSNTRDVRHILAGAEEVKDADGNVTDDGFAKAKEDMDEIEKLWNESSKSVDAFASLANTKSEDTRSNTNGGLYEGVPKGEMVEEFDTWLFDESRKTGDTGVVKTEFGYHLMYYVGENEPAYKLSIDSTLRNEMYNSWIETITLETVVNE